MAESLQLQGNIQYNTGRPGDIPLPIVLTLNSLAGTAMGGPVQASLASGANNIPLPITTAQFAYVKNTHASQTITVSWTAGGVAAPSLMVLRPGDWIMFSASVGAGSGITVLGLNASGAATTCEYILFG